MREPTPEEVLADLFAEQDEPEGEVRSDFPPQPGDVTF